MTAPTPTPLTEDEKLELELAEQARIASDSWDSVAPGKAENFGKTFRRLIGLLRPHAFAFAFVSLLGAVSVLLTVIAPKVLGEATNIIFEGFISARLPPGATQAQAVEQLRSSGQTDLANMLAAMQITPGVGVDFVRLSQVLMIVLALYLVASVLSWLQGYVINVIMVRTMWRLREAVEAKINRMPLSHFDKVQRGELLSRVTNDIDNITQTMQQSLSGALTAVLTVVGVLIMMFSISWQLAIVALVSLPLMAVIFGVIGPKSQKAFGIQWRKMGRLNARVEESFSGHALVKVFGREQDSREKFKAENEELYQA
ncbi:MAG: ATP-binding cassette, subfamily multidrug efflux pump, partial [Microbacteriaceae bacterium]|nr:ATP-binding cassette, subfamily multidrug efflux pump [Microbacteriaceae bacterium]